VEPAPVETKSGRPVSAAGTRGRRGRRSFRAEESELNVTPLLDVVFIMLIFFIVTASFLKESAIDLTRSSAGPTLAKAEGNIVILIDPNGRFWLNGRPTSEKALRANIEKARADNPGAKVIVHADGQSKTGALVRVIDESRLAGIYDVSIASE
jgi:biopolymer transport protein ExbD